jgi:hypothetical protein
VKKKLYISGYRMRGCMEGKFGEFETNCEKENIIGLYKHRNECVRV